MPQAPRIVDESGRSEEKLPLYDAAGVQALEGGAVEEA
jgi:hypothetical protein